MKKTLIDEPEFQAYIIEQLVAQGYVLRDASKFDSTVAMDREMLLQFLQSTQPKTIEKLRAIFQENTEETIINCINMEITKPHSSLIQVLKNGLEIAHQPILLMYMRPATSFNPKQTENYNKNILSVMKEVWANDKERIDLVIYLNGLPIISFELKCNQSGQSYEDAIYQYRFERTPKSRLFWFKAGCIVNFAMDLQEVYMTTHLDGKNTYFLPFNIGAGDGINTGKGNPIYDDKFSVSYMWEDILTKETIFDLLTNFVFVELIEEKDARTGKTKTKEELIFPRYHQLRVLRKAMADLRVNLTTQNYLIQHSAGSGKTKTIAWLAHRLVSLHDFDDNQIFDSIIIMTDRVVVDRQLQDAITQLEHKSGLIKVMDENCTSADLGKALASKTKIIATTIQKFLYIIDSVKNLKDKRFAVIIDEAHSSTAGKDMSAVTQVLGSNDDEELDVQELMEKEIRHNGKQPNVSMFAFTATPKATTLQLFGRPGIDGKNHSFDLYSMKQAIEEEFIVDVLTNFIEYKTYFQLNKTIEEDPEYKSRKAKKKIAHLVDVTDENIEKRVEVIAEHFFNVVKEELGNQAKAMVITASREAAVKFSRAFNKYVEEHQLSDVKSLVAFSGKLKLDKAMGAQEYTETGMNGFSEEKLPEKFNSPEYNVLIVANKYQTGFDQKKLAAMYVLKTLKGITAVQTLSRLNRICPPYKKKTFILDFCNTYDDIVKSFSTYYEATILSNTVTPQDLYTLDKKIDRFNILDSDDIDAFVDIIYKRDLSEKDKMQAEGYLQKAAKRIDSDTDEKKQKDVKNALKHFVRLYEFVIQATGFEDTELHKRYKFIDALQDWFKRGKSGSGFSLEGKVAAVNFENRRQGVHNGEGLVSNPYVSLPTAEADLTEDEEKKLSEIINELNSRTGSSFDKSIQAKALMQIKEILLQDEHLQQSALVNKEDDFKFTYFDGIDDALLKGLEQNQEFFSLLLNNEDIKKQVLGIFVSDIYKSLKNKQ